MAWRFRAATAADGAILREFLHLALFVPPGEARPPFDLVFTPALARYVEGWGRAGDAGLLALDGTGRIVGAAWLRLWTEADRGYGFVDAFTPELSVAVRRSHRGRGLGTELLARLLAQAEKSCPAISLSVSPDNPARRLYERLGFRVIASDAGALTMVRRRGGSAT